MAYYSKWMKLNFKDWLNSTGQQIKIKYRYLFNNY